MKTHTLATTGLCLTLALGGFAVTQVDAAATAAPLVLDQEQITGTIVKVNLDRNMFVIQTSSDKTIEIKVNAETKYFVDGEEATKAETLLVGAKASVQHEEKQATRIDVRSS